MKGFPILRATQYDFSAIASAFCEGREGVKIVSIPMFTAQFTTENTLALSGRLDSVQTAVFLRALDQIEDNCTIDFMDLVYISSSGLAALVNAQKRLVTMNKTLKLRNMNSHVREVFTLARFQLIFEIE